MNLISIPEIPKGSFVMIGASNSFAYFTNGKLYAGTLLFENGEFKIKPLESKHDEKD